MKSRSRDGLAAKYYIQSKKVYWLYAFLMLGQGLPLLMPSFLITVSYDFQVLV